jgi:nitrogen regulatory protein P-II 1
VWSYRIRLSLVVEDQEVDAVTSIIRAVGRVGPHISGYVPCGPVGRCCPSAAQNDGWVWELSVTKNIIKE